MRVASRWGVFVAACTSHSAMAVGGGQTEGGRGRGRVDNIADAQCFELDLGATIEYVYFKFFTPYLDLRLRLRWQRAQVRSLMEISPVFGVLKSHHRQTSR